MMIQQNDPIIKTRSEQFKKAYIENPDRNWKTNLSPERIKYLESQPISEEQKIFRSL